jgi:hypothetical protein
MSCFETSTNKFHVKIVYWGTYREPAILQLEPSSPFTSLAGCPISYHLRTIPTKSPNDPRRARWIVGVDGLVLVLRPEGAQQRRLNLLPELASLLTHTKQSPSPSLPTIESTEPEEETKIVPWVLYTGEEIIQNHRLIDGVREEPRQTLFAIIQKVFENLQRDLSQQKILHVEHYLQAPGWVEGEQAQARNPNISAKDLRDLARHYPNDALQNQALPLLLLEDPSLLQDTLQNALRNHLQHTITWGRSYFNRANRFLFRAGVAERVLWVYEQRFPQDERVREVIEVSRAYAKGECPGSELKAADQGTQQALKEAHELAGECTSSHSNDPVAGAAAHAAITAIQDDLDVDQSALYTLELFMNASGIQNDAWLSLCEKQWQADFLLSLLKEQGVDLSQDTWGWPSFLEARYQQIR